MDDEPLSTVNPLAVASPALPSGSKTRSGKIAVLKSIETRTILSVEEISLVSLNEPGEKVLLDAKLLPGSMMNNASDIFYCVN